MATTSLANISNVSDLMKALTSSASDTALNTKVSVDDWTKTQTSPYNLTDWLKSKGLSATLDPSKNVFSVGNFAIPENLTTGLTTTQGYGTEQQYQDIYNNYVQQSKTFAQQNTPTSTTETGEYISPYQEQINALMEQLKNMTPYQTPQELEQYLMNLLQSANQPFSYNPANDEALKIAQQEAGRQVREAAGAKGTLYSSGTIAKTAYQQGVLIPQYEAVAYQRYADQKNREIQMATTLMQWDSQQAQRWQDQLKLVESKFNFIMQLDSQEFEKFQVLLEQRNAEREYNLQLQQFNLEKKMAEIENAYKRVEALGYVDKQTSVILGLKVGEKAEWVKQLEQQQKNDLAKIQKEFENNKKLAKDQAKVEKDMIKYKQSLEDASNKKRMAEQYKLDKQLAEYQYKLSTGGAIGNAGITTSARSLLGLKYVYGGNSTTKGMDCSAFTQYVMGQNGVNLPRTAMEQSKVGTKVSWDSLKEGDLIFFDTLPGNSKNVDHVGIYAGNGKMIHASSGSGKVVEVNLNTTYWKSKFTVARRNTGSGGTKVSSGSSSGSVSGGGNTTGTSTSQIQKYLQNYGIGISADGKYGPKTKEAVIQFQKAKGLKPDGIVGPKTLAALKKYTKSTVKKPSYA